MYKILKLIDGEVYSPIQNHYYGKLNDVMGKKMICEDYDDSDVECSNGFYAVEPEGLIYAINSSKENRVFEVEMSGRNRRFNEYKHRYEGQIISRLLTVEETKRLIKEQSDKMEWNYYSCVYPINPFNGEKKELTKKIFENVQECIAAWNSVEGSAKAPAWDSAWNSAWGSVWNSVWNSVKASAKASVKDSTWDFVWAYIGYQFQNCSLWENGIYKYRCFIDLWNEGFVMSYDGNTYELRSGKNADMAWRVRRNGCSSGWNIYEE